MILGRKVYYLTSFVAGGVLLACELLIAKLISPHFGASLYVWAATIGTTLTGLALGYYYSGNLSEKSSIQNILFKTSLFTSIYLLVLPIFSQTIMEMLIGLDIIPGILLSTTLFNLPLFFLMGIYSPLIIQLLSISNDDAGNYAGRIYGLSTISGVFFLVITGVFLLPSIGCIMSVYTCASLMFIITIIQFLNLRSSEK